MALVDNRYKFLTDMDGAKGGDLLFDLVRDPGETANLAAQQPEVVKAMKVKLAEFRESCKRSLAGKDYPVPFTPDQDDVHPSERGGPARKSAAVPGGNAGSGKRAGKAGTAGQEVTGRKATPGGEAEQGKVALQNDDSGLVTLPAASATLHGSLIYRADQDKIGLWSNVKDWLSWEFEIHQPGAFKVEVSCGHTADGSVYEITAGDQRLRSTVSASGDFKKPKPQIAGTMTLPKPGRYTLSLKPVSKKGAVVMALWKVDLIPVKE
jgi:hypothetical protein